MFKSKNNESSKPAPKDDMKDDGRVYADMSVLDDHKTSLPLFGGKKKKKPKIDQEGYPLEEDNTIDLSKKEKKAITRGVIKAHLVYALLGLALIVLVFLFLIFVWLK